MVIIFSIPSGILTHSIITHRDCRNEGVYILKAPGMPRRWKGTISNYSRGGRGTKIYVCLP